MNLTPLLLFDGNCAEAMAFCQSCLGGELTITRLGDTPMGDQASPEQQHKVTYACPKGDGCRVSGGRLAAPHPGPQTGQHRRRLPPGRAIRRT